MQTRHFNLVTQPWLEVVRQDTEAVETVSLKKLFEHMGDYRQLAGDMEAQDFVVLRFLLAILQTVYTRFDADGRPYDWLTVDADKMTVTAVADEDDVDLDDLLETWHRVYEEERFGPVVGRYLEAQLDHFDFFGDDPFYQVTNSQYDRLVPADKKIITGNGQVAIRQLNRTVSKSGNSVAVFSPRSRQYMDQLTISELVRWVMMFQNYTAVTDKTKLLTDTTFSKSAGWVFGLNPVYLRGETLFETLVLNMMLTGSSKQSGYHVERPVWESPSIDQYLEERKKGLTPDNLAALYTTWSRLLSIWWDDNDRPHVFSAGIPMFSGKNARIEPMTLWRKRKKDGEEYFEPAEKKIADLDKANWRNFGEYVPLPQHFGPAWVPGVALWLNELKDNQLVPEQLQVRLHAITLIKDGPKSQVPDATVSNELRINLGVLFDDHENDFWAARIESAIALAQKIGAEYEKYLKDLAMFRGEVNHKTGGTFTSIESTKFYYRLNKPFEDWLSSLSLTDDRDVQYNEWKKIVRSIAFKSSQSFIDQKFYPDLKGRKIMVKGEPVFFNIMTITDQFRIRVNRALQ